jgi:diguanylate cyclase (GGDEF)-like protein/PAS domain S-box-containing protein
MDKKHSKMKLYAPAIAAFTVVVAITISGFLINQTNFRRVAQIEFNQASQERVAAIRRVINENLLSLESMQSMYVATKGNPGSELRAFVEPYEANLEGVQALQWIMRVTDEERESFEMEKRREGIAGFQIMERKAPGVMERASRRAEYYPVVPIPPVEEGEASVGFDLGSDPIRLQTLKLARDTGQTTASGRVTLVHEQQEENFGFLVFAPVYATLMPLRTIHDRRESIRGFAIGVFLIRDIVEAAMRVFEPAGGLNVTLFDNSAPESERLLYHHRSRTINDSTVNNVSRQDYKPENFVASFQVKGRTWSVVCSAAPFFMASRKDISSWLILLTGFSFALLLLRYLLVTTRQASKLREEITERKQAEIELQENKRQMATLISNLPGMVYRCNNDPNWTMEFTSDGCQSLTGYKPEEFINNKKVAFSELIHPEDTQMTWAVVQEALKSHKSFQIIYRIITRNGELKWVWEQGQGVFSANNEFLALEGFIADITERKLAEEELLKLSRAVEYSPAAVYITDLDGNIEYINPKFTEITGYSSEEVIGENPRILKSGEIPEEIYTDLWTSITSGKDWKGEFHNRRKDGSLYWARNSISCVKNREGEVIHYIALQEDATHEYELSEQLTFQASHDALTRLINRREFERRAERLLSSTKQDKSEHALCYMDLDQFKVVNDTCGHAAGDELLRQLSTVLLNSVRHRDTLARLGGDEFGVLMEHCSLDDAHRVATTLLKVIQDYQFSWEGHTFKIGVSVGLVAITPATTNLSELIRDADAACYMAKDKGRNRIHVYHIEDVELAQRHGEMQWVTRLNQALEEDRFFLYAQTIVPLDGNSTEKHYELLIRMKNEKGEIILPGFFLPAAERYNLIVNIDRWVLEETFSLLSTNPDFLKQNNFCSINLSGQSITDDTFLDFAISKINESGIDAMKICFEITETAAISNLNTASKFMSSLKELGCRFALDDFGSGLSSFAYLKNLPVDYLKIDGMFVKDIVDDPIDRSMVKSINEIGQVMGMKTIAEFVENDEIKGMLREIGVNYAQGYGIGKPQPFIEILGQIN